MYLLRALIYQEFGKADKYAQEMEDYMKHYPKFQKDQEIVIQPFDISGRLCEQFDVIQMVFPKSSSFRIFMRLSFSMPFIKPPNMIPNVDEDAIQAEFNLKQIDAPMPEAPWVRNCQN